MLSCFIYRNSRLFRKKSWIFNLKKDKAFNESDLLSANASFNSTVSNSDQNAVEKIYQKKSQVEHVLLRPDTYIGSTTLDHQETWIYDDKTKSIIRKEIKFSPGLYKLFDEILVNAADNKERDPNMTCVKINVDKEKNTISIYNDGMGIPVTLHRKENMYVPTLIFGHLLTSSNYNDNQKKIIGGRNGFGAKLCNIFSSSFTVETASKKYGKKFKQEWKSNMSIAEEPIISDFSGNDFTCVTFRPDLNRFGLKGIDKDLFALFKRRAYDIAGVTSGVSVFFNDEFIDLKGFQQYSELYLKGFSAGLENATFDTKNMIYQKVNDRWEICITPVDCGPLQMSFVNSIATTKGGTHVNYVMDQIVQNLVTSFTRGAQDKNLIKPAYIKSNLFLFVNCRIENPSFDSQTKEYLVLNKQNFGSTCEPSPAFLKSVLKITKEAITNFINMKANTAMSRALASKKICNLSSIPKLDDANKAGSYESLKCTLILTEGDSAKSLAVAGISVVGRNYYGIFPLKGKLLNVRNASQSAIMENAEISNLIKIIGLNFKNKYENASDLKSLRYGKVMIMTDQDEDGSHIKGLIINFIHSYWPNLLKHNFFKAFITPLIKVFHKKKTLSFFSYPEYQEWRDNQNSLKNCRIKYYKGLGTSTSAEAKEYFSNMDRHVIDFNYKGESCDQAIKLAFSKENVSGRKIWLDSNLAEAKKRKQHNLPELYLYKKDTTGVSYSEFINMDLVVFSNADNVRAIPNMIDGLKPSQRKVLYTMFVRYEKKEVKVAQLSGAVAELTSYHHGEMSLQSTIVGLAQDFVGSNNINLLLPQGQFGSRLNGGKDAASARYIFTSLNPLTRFIFPLDDDYILTHKFEDNQMVEPENFVPIIPMILVNGTEGIGTGYASKIPNYNPIEIVDMLIDMISNDSQATSLTPWYKGFSGEIVKNGDFRYSSLGSLYRLKEDKLEINELPLKTWTQNYKEDVLIPLINSTSTQSQEIVQPVKNTKKNGKKITSENSKSAKKASNLLKKADSDLKLTELKEHHSDSTVRFVLNFEPGSLNQITDDYLFKQLKLESVLNTSSMVLFDKDNIIKKYDDVSEIIQEFFQVRMVKYEERKDYMVKKLEALASKLQNQARFILEVIDEKIIIRKKTKQEFINLLKSKGYSSDPLKLWQKSHINSQNKDAELLTSDLVKEQNEEPTKDDFDYEYLYNLSLIHLTNEKRDRLLEERDKCLGELESLMLKTPKQLWLHDLFALKEELLKIEKNMIKINKPGSSKNQQDIVEVSPMVSKRKGHIYRSKEKITPLRVSKVSFKPLAPGKKPQRNVKLQKNVSVKKSPVKKLSLTSEEDNDIIEVLQPKILPSRKRKPTKVVAKFDDTISESLDDSYYNDEDYM